MKIKMNIKRMVVGLMTVSICCGCADLSEDLTGQPTSDKFFKTIVDFNSYISGAYTPLVKLYGEDAPYVACAGAEDVCTPVVRWKGFEQVNINTVGNPEEVTDILWNNCYSSISACNTTIELVAQNTNLTAEELSPIDGEAKFLRAFGYFQLVRWFGEVPLLTEANQKNASVEPQAAIADIYKQIVVDLQSAETTLPSKREDRTRPTSWNVIRLEKSSMRKFIRWRDISSTCGCMITDRLIPNLFSPFMAIPSAGRAVINSVPLVPMPMVKEVGPTGQATAASLICFLKEMAAV